MITLLSEIIVCTGRLVYGRRSSAVLLLLFIVPVVPAHAQKWPDIDGMNISIYVRADRNPALTEKFVNKVSERSQKMLRVMLGHRLLISQITVPALDNWLADNSLHDATARIVEQAGCNTTPRTILVDIRYADGTYQITAAEYDDSLFQISKPVSSTTLQREMVPMIAGRLVLQAWSAVGVIADRQGDIFTITMNNLQHLASVPEWSNIRKDAILQLFHEVIQDGQVVPSPEVRNQFLVVTEVHPNALKARLAVDHPDFAVNGSFFHQLNHSDARYLARVIPERPMGFDVQVFIRETNAPRESCSVLVSTIPLAGVSSSRRVGLTNASGIVAVPPSGGGLLYVTVEYDSARAQRICVPGISDNPLRFDFNYQGDRPDFPGILHRLEDDIESIQIRVNLVTDKINLAIQTIDVDELESLAVDRQRLLSELHSLAGQADVVVASVSKTSPHLFDQAKAVQIRCANVKSGVESSQVDIGNARLKMYQIDLDVAIGKYDWDAARSILREYAPLKRQLGEADTKEEERWKHLEKYLPPQNAEHASARSVIEKAHGIQRASDLLSRWGELKNAFDQLIIENDYYWIVPILKEYDGWAELLEKETALCIADGQGNLDEAAQKEHIADLQRLKQISDEYNEIQTELAEIHNHYPFR